MAGFIPEIRRLSELRNGVQLSFDLVLYLGAKSRGVSRSEWGYEKRPSDPMADELIVSIISRLSAIESPDGPWFLERESTQLKLGSDHVRSCNVLTYFANSVKLLEEYKEYLKNTSHPATKGLAGMAGVAQAMGQELKSVIDELLKPDTLNFTKSTVYSGHASIITNMVPEIRKLSERYGGLDSAFDLVSYSD